MKGGLGTQMSQATTTSIRIDDEEDVLRYREKKPLNRSAMKSSPPRVGDEAKGPAQRSRRSS